MNNVTLDPDLCRVRQGRLLDYMNALKIDATIVVSAEHVQYLTGYRWDFRFSPVAALLASGESLLICPDKVVDAKAVDDVRSYAAKWRSTLRTDQREASAHVLKDYFAGVPSIKRVGVEFSTCPVHVTHLFSEAEIIDIDRTLLEMRRHKEKDEIALLKRAIDATGEMYRVAREIIHPGVVELDVFSALQAAAVSMCGEMLTGTGNDYAAGVRGGPPRQRRCLSEELYILDLGPAYRGYFADNARTIAVDGNPTDDQLIAWNHVCQAFDIVERVGQPGVRCRDIYDEVQQWLNSAAIGSWSSHLGHGIGLFVHEGPHLNPHWDDTLEVGDVIAVEPALYAPGLSCGIRLENDYIVTKSGLELLSPFPLEL